MNTFKDLITRVLIILVTLVQSTAFTFQANSISTRSSLLPIHPTSFPLFAKVIKSDEEWRQQLSPAAFNVLRREGTEPPFSSELNDVKQPGTFACAGCGSPLFQYSTKYNSGTGWPSFYDAIDRDAVDLKTDYKLVMPRTEVTCKNCGGHLGHVFDDGPKPTGKRYCMNGVAMQFIPVGDDLELDESVAKRVENVSYTGTTVKTPMETVLPSIGLDAVVAILFLSSFLNDKPLEAIQNWKMENLTLLFPLGVGSFYAYSAVKKILSALA
jgi:peptide-methionine (R)-S-oxide reductase